MGSAIDHVRGITGKKAHHIIESRFEIQVIAGGFNITQMRCTEHIRHVPVGVIVDRFVLVNIQSGITRATQA